MDFNSLKTDDLLAALPIDHEDDRWEVKGADFLEPAKRDELKKELGKQVSAFANSGGGFLVFGISNDRRIEPCKLAVGRQPMKDYLSTMVEQSVEHPIRAFRIHRVPFTNDPSNSVFVIEIHDSPAAPHQAKEERRYFYRIDGHSKPAPHFHLELLRNRLTKAILEIGEIEFSLVVPLLQTAEHRNEITLSVTIRVPVTNISTQIADPYALRVCESDSDWTILTQGLSTPKGALLQNVPQHLFPSLTALFEASFVSYFPKHFPLRVDRLTPAWESLAFTLQAVSHNFVGEPKPVSAIATLGSAAMPMLEGAIQKYHDEIEAFKRGQARLAESVRRMNSLGEFDLDVR